MLDKHIFKHNIIKLISKLLTKFISISHIHVLRRILILDMLVLLLFHNNRMYQGKLRLAEYSIACLICDGIADISKSVLNLIQTSFR